ncbi:MAG: GNAT family N-acetyltransferase [Syntrophobacteraceae bacterium]|nr:GNAT family N-acetyltransferase [Desulfobacteraceae bacterium]
MTESSELKIRLATVADVPLILSLIRELAVYEKLEHAVTATEEDLRETLFVPRAYAEVLLGSMNGKPEAYALFFHSYSTFLGRQGMYLEDLYVRPHARGRGLGKTMLLHLARLAVERGCKRLEWAVLDWNKPAIDFYRSLGAEPLDEWTVFRLTGNTLESISGKS